MTTVIPNFGGSKPFPWTLIVVEALLPFAGRTLPPGTAYQAIERHPHARIRVQLGDASAVRIEAVLDALARAELVWPTDEGGYRVSSHLSD
ncbi:MAG: hypothetical protein K8H88_06965 [Sandaracinaceae bacterium]|nr:hypothetical protein [Sandaracinaceae bacterium]